MTTSSTYPTDATQQYMQFMCVRNLIQGKKIKHAFVVVQGILMLFGLFLRKSLDENTSFFSNARLGTLNLKLVSYLYSFNSIEEYV
jgi:hypothetical protein